MTFDIILLSFRIFNLLVVGLFYIGEVGTWRKNNFEKQV